jgi:hypothetical protein
VQTQCLNCGNENCDCIATDRLCDPETWLSSVGYGTWWTFALLALALIALDLMNLYDLAL